MTYTAAGNRESRYARVKAVAGRQWGKITTEQLRSCGLSDAAISRWVAADRLSRDHPAVYTVGPASRAPEARWSAALLWCGDDSALGVLAAAANFRLVAPPAVIDIFATRRMRKRPGVRVSARRVASADVTVVNGLRTTTVERTLLDLARSGATIERLVANAIATGLTTRTTLQTYAGLRRGTPGVRRLRRAVFGEVTRSGVEREFVAWLRSRGLPVPSMNRRIGPLTVDGIWEDVRLVVEIDTFQTHGTPHSFENDRLRDAFLLARGLRTLRITPNRWRHDGDRLERDIRAARART